MTLITTNRTVGLSGRLRPEMPIRVSAAQLELGWGDYRMAVENAAKLVRKASEQGAGIVCFPEHWLLEYREHGQRALEQLCDAARETKTFVITGANYMPDEAPKSTELPFGAS